MYICSVIKITQFDNIFVVGTKKKCSSFVCGKSKKKKGDWAFLVMAAVLTAFQAISSYEILHKICSNLMVFHFFFVLLEFSQFLCPKFFFVALTFGFFHKLWPTKKKLLKF